MPSKHFSLTQSDEQSFLIRRDRIPRYPSIWHDHQELELVYVIKGTGTLCIGDSIRTIPEDSIVLIPSLIPHYWLFEDQTTGADDFQEINCLVAHFRADFGIVNLLRAPEFHWLNTFLNVSRRGLLAVGKSSPSFIAHLNASLKKSGIDRFFEFLKTLQCLSNMVARPLLSDSYSLINHIGGQTRMNDLMEYIRKNFRNQILLSELANIAGLTPNSCSRYFKQKVGKTPIQFINELRISYACQQLSNSQLNLKTVCFDSGFNNFVSFHKTFKRLKAMTPGQFRLQGTPKFRP
ncbi:MAG: AraC family transcriptional regulator [Sphingobacterium sp.]